MSFSDGNQTHSLLTLQSELSINALYTNFTLVIISCFIKETECYCASEQVCTCKAGQWVKCGSSSDSEVSGEISSHHKCWSAFGQGTKPCKEPVQSLYVLQTYNGLMLRVCSVGVQRWFRRFYSQRPGQDGPTKLRLVSRD